MIRIAMLFAVSLTSVVLGACGQKGPLFFPPTGAEPYQTPERSAPPEFPTDAPAPTESATPTPSN